MRPYYKDSHVVLYHGDAREILPKLTGYEAIITDPVWPNCKSMEGQMPGTEDSCRLLKDVIKCAKGVKRIVIHMGCDSDPRFLKAIPKKYPFRRICWLRYARPSYKGRLLNGSDIGYVFGEWPDIHWNKPLQPGESQTAGEICDTSNQKRDGRHPCPRKYGHVKWLVRCFGAECILDPFAGSGTTLLAAKEYGYKAIGIEIEKRFCEIAVDRLKQNVFEWENERKRNNTKAS